MTAAITLALLAALPEGTARYRVELAGEPIGWAALAVRCEPERCALTWETALRAPEEAGGALRRRRVTSTVDRAGRLAGPVEVREDGATRPGRAVVPGRVPSAAAELVLLAAGAPSCVEAFDEERGATGLACGRRDGPRVRAEVLGDREELTPAADGFPAEVSLPAQGVRYLRDPTATAPARAPRLAVRVPGPPVPAAARRFCGLAPDPPPADAPPAEAPPARPTAGGCRPQAEAYAAAAARAGLRSRVAVGVVHDGAGFAWHAWAEVRRGRRWIAVDPALGQAPAEGPRFTVGRYDPADAGARAEAGRRILACWGRGGVE